MMNRLLPVLIVAATLSLADPARAGTVQTTMNVSATVQNSCIISAAPMLFGNYDPVSASPTNASTSITVTCTTGTSFGVGLSAGSTSGSTVSSRHMGNAANRLSYALFSDSGRTTNWGNSPGVDAPSNTIATASPSVLSVYGQIPAQQNIPAGAYSDTVTVTVTY